MGEHEGEEGEPFFKKVSLFPLVKTRLPCSLWARGRYSAAAGFFFSGLGA